MEIEICFMDILNSLIEENKSFYIDTEAILFDLQKPSELDVFNEVLIKNRPLVFDDFENQLIDLIKNQNPSKILTSKEINSLIKKKYPNIDLLIAGKWVYYPWNNKMVHILNQKDFIELRTVRNKYKITQEEQDILATKKIGVVGLSVGQSVSLALSLERSYGELRIADFDTLELSNLNRIRTPVLNLGIKKVIVVKREILELDPYLNIRVFKEGLIETKIEEFISGLDIIVDEFDDIRLKLKLRKIARRLKIPVISETSDRGLVDIERYDSNSNLLVYNGNISNEVLNSLESYSNDYLFKNIISFESLSTRMQFSLNEIGTTIKTWPQLGADVSFGGALCAILIRKILLNKKIPSKRIYFDIDQILEIN